MTALSSLAPWLWLAALALGAHALKTLPQGGTLVFALAAGTALGLLLQRTRFCFYCHARDWFQGGDPRGLLAIILLAPNGAVGLWRTLEIGLFGRWREQRTPAAPAPTKGPLAREATP